MTLEKGVDMDIILLKRRLTKFCGLFVVWGHLISYTHHANLLLFSLLFAGMRSSCDSMEKYVIVSHFQ